MHKEEQIMPIETRLPESLRQKHAQNMGLGCGNFFHIACATSPFADQQHFAIDKDYQVFTGEVYKGFSLTELKFVVDTYASWYYGVGVRAKDPIAVYIAEGIGNLIHYLALNAIGAIPAIVNGNMPAEIAAKWIQKVGAQGLFSDQEHASVISPHVRGNSALMFFVTDESAYETYKPSLPPVYPFKHTESDTVLIGHSSGTTGIPKAVQFQHQQFFYGIRYRLSLPFPNGSERILSALPHSHSAGIAYAMLATLNGCQVMVLSSNRPEVVLPNIEKFRPSMVVAFPEAYVLLNDSDLDSYDLNSIELWFNGGDAAHEPHIRRLISKGHHFVDGERRPGSIFIDGLGSSEMGFSLFRNIHTIYSKSYNRCIGKPLEWVDAAVLGENGEKLPPFRVGKLGVRSPTITPGYWNDSVLTARSQLNGYFLTGDLFYTDEEGRFFHVDRVPDAIRTRGGMVYSLETEEILLKHFSEIADCSLVATPSSDGFENAVAVVRFKREVRKAASLFLEAFNRCLRTAGKKELSLVLFAGSSQIPLGPTGKVLKRELREQFQEQLNRSKPNIPEPLHA